jgi:hypothetical protein
VHTLLLRTTALAAALTGTLALSACGGPDVTRPRLEASLAPTFANLYVQQAGILGRPGVTVGSTAAKASCDRGGPKVTDVGPGADWICMVSFRDNKSAKQNGKFEVQVRSNSCYTAGGPSKLIGLATISDRTGKDVANPVFEFDGCFDPAS